MSLTIVITSLLVLNILILFIQAKVTIPESDHPYHLGLINGIRKSKHRFLLSHPNFIGEINFGYPQFFHWVLSFLPKAFLDNYYYFIGAVLNILSLVLFLVFAIWAYPLLYISISIEYFVLYVGLLYILTPFSWAIWNAKNTGISTRGLGLFLGYLYQFLILLYFYSGSFVFLFFIFITVFIILISSQFANQFVLLTLPFFAILYNNYFLLSFPLLAFLLFYLINKEVALKFLRAQYWHKTIYYKYLAKVFILKSRPSIWRDLIYDIWKNIIKRPATGLLYAYHNPVISITVGIPVLGYLVFVFLVRNTFYTTEIEKLLFYNIIIALSVFFLTSLRKTRFLGEPERYVELAIPSIVLLSLSITNESYLSITKTILIVSILLIGIQFLTQYVLNKVITKNNPAIKGQELVKTINQLQNQQNDLRVFSNNQQFLKYVVQTDAKVIYTNLTSLHTGSFSFTEIYPEKYGHISNKVIPRLIKEFDINCFILDTSMCQIHAIPLFNELGFAKHSSTKNFDVYITKTIC